jgi:hypothetical protein
VIDIIVSLLKKRKKKRRRKKKKSSSPIKVIHYYSNYNKYPSLPSNLDYLIYSLQCTENKDSRGREKGGILPK